MTVSVITIQTGWAIPPFLIKEVRSKLAYIDPAVVRVELQVDGEVRLHLDPEPDPQRQSAMERSVRDVVSVLVQGTREPVINVLDDYLATPVPCRANPMALLQEAGEVVREGAGSYSLGPVLTWVLRFLQQQLDLIAFELGAQPRHFPAMLPASMLQRIKYFRSFPHSLTFVSHIREELGTIERFSRQARCEGEVLHMPDGSLAPVRNLLSPAICYHNYLAMADQTLRCDPLITTATGACFRFEASNMEGLERLWNFTMWEVIFVGSEAGVMDGITRALQVCSRLLQRLGLAFRLENANDPFFVGEFATQATFQYAYDLKYEFLAWLPYRDGLFAVGSRNYHRDFFGRALNIRGADGQASHSGCVGFGLERLAYALVAQYGLDPEQWPEALRRAWNQPLIDPARSILAG
ncbi:MAG: hypothetical protein HQM01_03340 [Magnetococcales bacterium]|nr:hypothetical protein [Magnetococcales bacterium]